MKAPSHVPFAFNFGMPIADSQAGRSYNEDLEIWTSRNGHAFATELENNEMTGSYWYSTYTTYITTTTTSYTTDTSTYSTPTTTYSVSSTYTLC